VCHGLKGFKDWGFFPYVVERLARAGFAAVSFNFSGSGVGGDGERFDELERFAHNTYSQELQDLHIVLDAVTNGAFGSTSRALASAGTVRGSTSWSGLRTTPTRRSCRISTSYSTP